ncbi:MAG: sodium-dependent bicarbonate transport family permease [Alphaproteobacteria bacterium]|nr:sodium-dependent bicarbonate transport family permease [Alphaproteobacteria bacterium]MBO6627662.1 sodium-dependent bicarbonate transport family permease [Alphaproteobacteria bacterium]MDF1627444.1 sodium-dependent bicarbonate transport family permease [Parvibaculaceae bacterium]
MIDVLSAAGSNFLSPTILAFVLGALAGFFRSDLEVPEAIAKGLSIYLMLAIGMKGGASLATSGVGLDVLPGLVAAVGLSFLIPFVAYGLLKFATRLQSVDAAAVSAHYGSVSIVTFVTATQFLTDIDVPYEAHVIAMVALMETPAIISGLMLARRNAASKVNSSLFSPDMVREIFFNGSIVLLLGGFAIGWASGPQGMASVSAFFVDPFQGVLCLFLLDMGLVAAHRLRAARSLTFSVVAFGLYMPLIGATFGAITGLAVGLSPGGAILLTVLSASASYIAVPAAMRLALPKADPGIYIPLSLGVTFPFNVLIGIPLYATCINAIVT